MKKLFVILLSMMMVVGVSAQKRSGGHYYRPRTRVVVGIGGYYPYRPYYPFSPYDYYWGSPYYNRPSRLEMKVEDIQSDYKDRIWSVRHDNKLTKSEKRKEIHQLKSERNAAIRDTERNYHRTY